MTITTSLQDAANAVQNSIDDANKTVESLEKQLQDAKESKKVAKQKYYELRDQLVLTELQNRKMTWCTKCDTVIDSTQSTLILTEGVKVESGGYQNDSWGCVKFSTLYRFCPACLQTAQDKHGYIGTHDPMNGLTEKFHAFVVTKQSDGYYARKFGRNMLLDNTHQLPLYPPNKIVERLVAEWNLCQEQRIDVD